MRTTTSPKAMRMSATTQAWAVVMSWAAEKWAMWLMPAACEDQMTKPSRKPMLRTHSAAALGVALMRTWPSWWRTRVSSPPHRPNTTPVAANAPISARSLPAVGMEWRYWLAAQPMMASGSRIVRAVSRSSRSWRKTMRTSAMSMIQSVSVMSSSIRFRAPDSINPRVGRGVEIHPPPGGGRGAPARDAGPGDAPVHRPQ
ncbi:hypothetical protein [Streptomyces fuscigenes]|uniref:hypothetical protein n=1 Tax=Streptomyces fuscigenes TaxID=1528880 RepID=UPI0027DEFE5A|nr:hypothetical protein [Streptomyces fuscigenes]